MDFRISLAQMNIFTADPQSNLRKAETCVREAVTQKAALVCLPEMWTTGFNGEKNRLLFEDHAKILDEVANLARNHGIWINGSMLGADPDGNPINNMVLIDDQGRIAATYAKTHLFSLFNEDRHMAPGRGLTVLDSPWGRLGFAVCYDLRFPELFRSYALKNVDIILLSAAFPFPRLEHWQILLRARAIENQFYVVAVNQVGDEIVDSGKVTYCGASSIIDPWGETVVEGSVDREDLLTADVDLNKLDDVRNRMPVFEDRRPDIYQI